MKRVLLASALSALAAFAQPAQKVKDKSTSDQKQVQVKEETTPQTDYVCGMTIDPKTAEAKYAYKGRMYYFCSKDDQEAFVKAPEKYIPKK